MPQAGCRSTSGLNLATWRTGQPLLFKSEGEATASATERSLSHGAGASTSGSSGPSETVSLLKPPPPLHASPACWPAPLTPPFPTPTQPRSRPDSTHACRRSQLDQHAAPSIQSTPACARVCLRSKERM